jgi:hypothetical protein
VPAADALQIIVTEYAEEPNVPVPENDEHVIIIDADTIESDNEEEFRHT